MATVYLVKGNKGETYAMKLARIEQQSRVEQLQMEYQLNQNEDLLPQEMYKMALSSFEVNAPLYSW